MDEAEQVPCLMGMEVECMNLAADTCDPARLSDRCGELIDEISQHVPSVPGPTGIFTGYGRFYVDHGHLELATVECDNPFTLISVWERMQRVTSRALHELFLRGRSLELANCNHSGLLTPHAPTWGTHGNYLVTEPPEGLADRLLPFLVSRVFMGSGGLEWPSGQLLASPRAHLLDRERGGGTTRQRAIHSTGRDEPLTSDPERFGDRYHTLLDDGVRSQFSLLLQHGTMSLVLNAVIADPEAIQTLPVSDRNAGRRSFWMQTLKRFNRLAVPGHAPAVDPLVCQIQDVYLAAADRYVSRLRHPPAWMSQLLAIWETTLSALRRNDVTWLGQRLDPWIKHRVFESWLSQRGHHWSQLPGNEAVASALALLNQDYHEFCNSDSVFAQLEASGELKHRVTAAIAPGSEPEPYVPQVNTRGLARARWIQERAGCQEVVADWMRLRDERERMEWSLDDPQCPDLPNAVPFHLTCH